MCALDVTIHMLLDLSVWTQYDCRNDCYRATVKKVLVIWGNLAMSLDLGILGPGYALLLLLKEGKLNVLHIYGDDNLH